LTLENSTWDAQKQHLSSESDSFITELPAVRLRFAHKDEVAKMPKRQTLDVPVYLNPLRKSVITSSTKYKICIKTKFVVIFFRFQI